MSQESRPGPGDASRRSAIRKTLSAAVEALETRRHLSVSPIKAAAKPKSAPVATVGVVRKGHGTIKPTKTLTQGVTTNAAGVAVGPFTPAQIRHFYGVDALSFGATAGNGAGQTIAIIDVDNQPNIKSDLATFDTTFGLPAPPTFVVQGETGGAPPTAYNADDALETSLDVEWAHAMAPAANILLIECKTFNDSDLFAAGVALANRTAGVSVVSMSFGGSEYSSETTVDQYFKQAGITYLASAGDGGSADTGYPGTSPYVVDVGGTSIVTSDANASYGSESVWNDTSDGDGSTGGGISTIEPKPTYQSTVTQSSTKRTAADVSFLADPDTGVQVYDTSQPGGGGFTEIGGTSLSAPCWAGLVADADQGRARLGLGTLSGYVPASTTTAQTLPRLYQLPAADFHDVTVGNNNYQNTGGYNANVGYDLPTGRGTPIANKLVPDLAGGTDSGVAFVDKNGNGVDDGTDTALSGVTVYVDVNGNGVFDTGDLSTTSSSTGAFTFSDVVGGLPIREVVPSGYVSTTSGLAGTTGYGAVSGLALGNFPLTFTGAVGTNSYTIRLDATGTQEQIFQNTPTTGAPTYTVAKSLLPGLAFVRTAGADTLTVDLTNGNPLIGNGGISFNGTGQSTGDTVQVIAGSTGTGFVGFGPVSLVIGNLSLNFTTVGAIAFVGGAGADTVSVTQATAPFSFIGGGGADTLGDAAPFAPSNDLGSDGSQVTLNLTASATTFATSQHLAGLNLSSGATAAFTTAGTLLRTGGLSIDTANGSYLDLNASGLIYDYTTATPDAAVTALLASGYAAGAWNGLGIRSTAAANDTTKKHALGNGEAAAALNLTGTATGTFLGETVDATTYLVRYTGYGDSDLNGTVTFSDFLRLQGAFGQTSDAFTSGNYNYDTKTTFADFLLLQGSFGLVT